MHLQQMVREEDYGYGGWADDGFLYTAPNGGGEWERAAECCGLLLAAGADVDRPDKVRPAGPAIIQWHSAANTIVFDKVRLASRCWARRARTLSEPPYVVVR